VRRRTDDWQPFSTAEAFEGLTVENLKPLAKLFTPKPPTRKTELVSLLTAAMRDPQHVRQLYDGLDPVGRAAVQEAVHDPRGELNEGRFAAKYGGLPEFYERSEGEDTAWSYGYGRGSHPKPLRLFFPQDTFLPTDLRSLLHDFVPQPRAHELPTSAEAPAAMVRTWEEWRGGHKVEEREEVALRLRETARDALHDVRAVLRLIDAGRLRVSDKKRQPTAAARKAVAAVLQGGDFYGEADQEEDGYDPSADLAIKAFAWPIIAQAAGLARPAGDNLELTKAGRDALVRPAPEVIRAAFGKWRASTLLDEYSRVEAIKGQGKARLSALKGRRQAVLDGLAQCPPGRWFAVEDFFRFLRATGRHFTVAHEPYALYIAEHRYGSLGYSGGAFWELAQGRYILAVLFEYVATLGLIDVGYVLPQGARGDYHGLWGTDYLASLSRYDGLSHVRINPLGAWCLDLAGRYEPPALPAEDVLQVLPNLEVVVKRPPPAPADRLLLDRFAEAQSEAVWRLDPARALRVLEEGGSLDELAQFLAARSSAPLPQTVQVFLDDLRRRAGQLRDLGTARLVECADAALAQALAAEPQLRPHCRLAGERWLVFRAEDEAAVRKALRRLGHVLPRQG
jgi:hypothetical protein